MGERYHCMQDMLLARALGLKARQSATIGYIVYNIYLWLTLSTTYRRFALTSARFCARAVVYAKCIWLDEIVGQQIPLLALDLTTEPLGQVYTRDDRVFSIYDTIPQDVG